MSSALLSGAVQVASSNIVGSGLCQGSFCDISSMILRDDLSLSPRSLGRFDPFCIFY